MSQTRTLAFLCFAAAMFAVLHVRRPQLELVSHSDLHGIRAGTTCTKTVQTECPVDGGGCSTSGVCAGGVCVNASNVYFTWEMEYYMLCKTVENEPGDYYCSPPTDAVCAQSYTCESDCVLSTGVYKCSMDSSTLQDASAYTYDTNYSETSGCGQSS